MTFNSSYTFDDGPKYISCPPVPHQCRECAESYLIYTCGHVVIKLFTTQETPYISLVHHVKLATSMYRRRLISL